MGISALSYFTIPYCTPGKELLYYYLGNISWLEKIRYKNPPVYAIKKDYATGEITYELYFYRYLAHRTFPSVVLDPSIPFYEIQHVHPIYQDMSIPDEYVITSIDVSYDGAVIDDHVTFYYKQPSENGYNYRAEEVAVVTEQNTLTNIYGMDTYILPHEPEHIAFLQKYKSEDGIAFVSKKLRNNSTGYYFENAKMQCFLDFLMDFSYDAFLIDFCKRNYDDTYRFCFSIDLANGTMQPMKTAIFSVNS